MRYTQIICDHCLSDITYTHNSVGYRIVLASERMEGDPNITAVTDKMVYPTFDQPLHFCNKTCLIRYIDKVPIREV